jgi:hypothetical protein
MTGAIKKRIAKLEARRAGDQIPIYCEEESEVPATIDQMIAAGELAEADRALGVYWLDCVGPNAPSDADLRSLLEQCEAEEQMVKAAEAGCVSTSPRPTA